MTARLMELIHAGALIITGILLLLFVFGVPGLGPIILVLALVIILLGVIKTKYHQRLLSQLKK